MRISDWSSDVCSSDLLVTTGRITAAIAFIIAIVLAPQIEHLGSGGFQFIQKFTGYVSPGILCIFLFGLFWKKTTTRAALTVAIVLLPLSIVVDKLLFPAMPFMNQLGLCFLVFSALTIGDRRASCRERVCLYV